jgi:thiol-disulfide isomerase/thioredoxin
MSLASGLADSMLGTDLDGFFMSDQVGKSSRSARGMGIWIGLAAILVAGSVLYLLRAPSGNSGLAPAAAATSPLAGLNKGEMAAFNPAGELKALPALGFKDADGKPLGLSAWHGKVVLLNLWATWCQPCRREMPALDQLKAAMPAQEFDVVALSTDRGSLDKSKKFWTETGVKSLQLYQDSGDAMRNLGIVGLPTTLLIDRQGREIGRLIGPAEWSSADAKALLMAALKP